jgi:hypothetical protein
MQNKFISLTKNKKSLIDFDSYCIKPKHKAGHGVWHQVCGIGRMSSVGIGRAGVWHQVCGIGRMSSVGIGRAGCVASGVWHWQNVKCRHRQGGVCGIRCVALAECQV